MFSLSSFVMSTQNGQKSFCQKNTGDPKAAVTVQIPDPNAAQALRVPIKIKNK